MWAGLILYQSKDWEQWVTSLSIDPRALEDSLYPQVFGREIGDRITVKRRPQGGATPTISDRFTRANSTTTLGSTESPVLAWTTHQGTWGIDTNRAYCVTSADGDTATVSVGIADMTVSAKITSPGAGRLPAVVARYVDLSNSYRAEVVADTAALRIFRRQGGVDTQLTTGITFADGDVVGLATIEESGSTRVSLYRNGTQQYTTLDSTSGRPAGTRAGLRWSGATPTAYFDDFSVVYGTGNVIVRDSFIRGVSHSFGPGPNRWATKWALQSASKYTFFTIGNATTGKLKAYGIA
jgi:hypothetical protein